MASYYTLSNCLSTRNANINVSDRICTANMFSPTLVLSATYICYLTCPHDRYTAKGYWWITVNEYNRLSVTDRHIRVNGLPQHWHIRLVYRPYCCGRLPQQVSRTPPPVVRQTLMRCQAAPISWVCYPSINGTDAVAVRRINVSERTLLAAVGPWKSMALLNHRLLDAARNQRSCVLLRTRIRNGTPLIGFVTQVGSWVLPTPAARWRRIWTVTVLKSCKQTPTGIMYL
jgi:hypothetical protein